MVLERPNEIRRLTSCVPCVIARLGGDPCTTYAYGLVGGGVLATESPESSRVEGVERHIARYGMSNVTLVRFNYLWIHFGKQSVE